MKESRENEYTTGAEHNEGTPGNNSLVSRISNWISGLFGYEQPNDSEEEATPPENCKKENLERITKHRQKHEHKEKQRVQKERRCLKAPKQPAGSIGGAMFSTDPKLIVPISGRRLEELHHGISSDANNLICNTNNDSCNQPWKRNSWHVFQQGTRASDSDRIIYGTPRSVQTTNRDIYKKEIITRKSIVGGRNAKNEVHDHVMLTRKRRCLGTDKVGEIFNLSRSGSSRSRSHTPFRLIDDHSRSVKRMNAIEIVTKQPVEYKSNGIQKETKGYVNANKIEKKKEDQAKSDLPWWMQRVSEPLAIDFDENGNIEDDEPIKSDLTNKGIPLFSNDNIISNNQDIQHKDLKITFPEKAETDQGEETFFPIKSKTSSLANEIMIPRENKVKSDMKINSLPFGHTAVLQNQHLNALQTGFFRQDTNTATHSNLDLGIVGSGQTSESHEASTKRLITSETPLLSQTIQPKDNKIERQYSYNHVQTDSTDASPVTVSSQEFHPSISGLFHSEPQKSTLSAENSFVNRFDSGVTHPFVDNLLGLNQTGVFGQQSTCFGVQQPLIFGQQNQIANKTPQLPGFGQGPEKRDPIFGALKPTYQTERNEDNSSNMFVSGFQSATPKKALRIKRRR